MKDCMEMSPGRLKALKALTSGNTWVVNLAWERVRRRYDGEPSEERTAAVLGELAEDRAAQGDRRVWQII